MIIANPIRAVILDLDGTLMDTACEIDSALSRTFGELGIAPLDRRAVEALIGRGVRSLVERALAGRGASANVDRAVESFERHYESLVGSEARLYPRVAEGLDLLRARNRKLGVVTNKPRLFTERLLDRAGVSAMFASVIAGDDGIARKPAGDMLVAACAKLGTTPAETLMVGDSENDILAARAAGCPVWCVPYGYNEGRPAETLQCDRLVETVEDAARLVIVAS
jgi:phosphoglycolate phosphatase